MRNCAVLRRALLAATIGGTFACGSENMGPIFRPSPTPETAVLVGAGDIAECAPGTAPEATARILDRVEGIVFTAGDNAYPSGREQDYRNCYESTWGRHKQRTRPSPGNHDYEVPGAAAYFAYFGSNAGPAGLGYYSYKAGGWTVLSLDSNIAAERGSAQLQWVQEQLSLNRTHCTVAYFHHPPFSSGEHGSNLFMHDMWRVFYAAGVDIVVAGHDHMYERFASMNGDGQADVGRGVRLFIAGTGGARLVAPSRSLPNSEFRTTQYGVLKLTLSAASYQWEFLQATGGVADSGVDVCR